MNLSGSLSTYTLKALALSVAVAQLSGCMRARLEWSEISASVLGTPAPLSITSHGDQAWTATTSFPVTGKCHEGFSVGISGTDVVPQSVPCASGTFTTTLDLSGGDGARTVELLQTLTDGPLTGVHHFNVDTIPPTGAAWNGSPPSGIIAGASARNIEWTVSDVGFGATPIQILFYDGSTWNSVSAAESNDGTMSWTVPSVNTSFARVRLVATDQAGWTATIETADFTIDSTPPSVALSNPSGLIAGAVAANITWATVENNPGSVALDYSLNSGAWTAIPGGPFASTGSHSTWTPPSGGSYVLRATATDQAGLTGSNTTSFTVDAANPTFTFSAPLASTLWKGGTAQNITWTATDDNFGATPIGLEFYDGAGWTTLSSAEANDSSYTFNIPGAANCTNCQIRATVTDAVGNVFIATSDGFRIDSTAPTVILSNPTGTIAGGAPAMIAWTTTDANPGSVTLEFSRNAGAWTAIPGGPFAASGSHSGWTPPGDDPYQVRATTTDLVGLSGTNTISFAVDSNFPSITLDNIAGGQVLIGGTPFVIEWTASDTNLIATPVTLYVSSDGGGNWTTLATNQPAVGTFSWNVPAVDATSYRIKAEAVDATALTSSASSSDIRIDNTNPSVLITPLVSMIRGDVGAPTVSISWTAEDAGGYPLAASNPIQIDFSSNNGTTYAPVAAPMPNTSPYTWTVPSVDSSGCLIRITATDAAGRTGAGTTSLFTIDSTAPSINLTSPAGGTYGPTQTIALMWTATDTNVGATPVTFHHSADGGNTWNLIASGFGASGSYGWVGPGAIAGTHQVRATATDLVGISSTTTATFTMDTTGPVVTLNAPANGAVIAGGSGYTILWNATDTNLLPNPITIEYSTDSGSTWNLIVSSLSNTPMNYNWSVPSMDSSTVRVRVKALDATAIETIAENTADLRIDNTNPDVTVGVVPGPGLRGGQSYTITWTANDTPYALAASPISIDYYDGTVWTPISSSEDNDGSFDWTVPSVDCAACTIRVSALDLAGRMGTATNAAFTIDSTAPALTIAPAPIPSPGWINQDPVMITGACETGQTVNFGGSGATGGQTAPCAGGAYTHSLDLVNGDGLKEISVAQSDVFGNSTTVNRSLMLDTVNPSGGFSGLASSHVGGTTPTISFTAADAGSGVQSVVLKFALDGTTFSDLGTFVGGGSYNHNLPNLNLPEATYRLVVTDIAGNTNTIDAIVPISTLAPLSVMAPNWNDYYRNGDPETACTGAEPTGRTACIHGGEQKLVLAPGKTSCVGITADDALGVFDWQCEIRGGYAYVKSRLKPGKGLGDLLNSAPAWKANSVTVRDSGTPIITAGTVGDWWGNPVGPLPDSSAAVTTLSGLGSIFVASANMTSRGYNIASDKIGLVTLAGFSINAGSTVSNNVNTSTGLATSPNATAMIAAGSRRSLWIEGKLIGKTATPSFMYGVLFSGVKQSVLRNLSLAQFTKDTGDTQLYSGITLNSNSNQNELSNVKIAHAANGIRVSTSSDNRASDIAITNCNGTAGILMSPGASRNAFSRVLISSNGNHGIVHENLTSNNTFTQITIAGNKDSLEAGYGNGVYIDAVDGDIYHQALVVGNDQINDAAGTGFIYGGLGAGATRMTLSQLALGHSYDLLYAFGPTTSTKITGNLFFAGAGGSNCGLESVSANQAGFSTSGCVAAGTSNHAVFTGTPMTADFVGLATVDAVNLSHASGSMSFPALAAFPTTDWFNFANPFRTWALTIGTPISGTNNNQNNSRGTCESGTCTIFDWSLRIGSQILNRSGNISSLNDTWSANSTCPSQVDGFQTLVSMDTTPQTYLKNAVELLGDGLGDDDGLCESDEACLYTPNIGGYQGHGPIEKCTFADGTISGVKMFGYQLNGY